MSWSNYGVHGWHIDHTIPCSKFNLKNLMSKKCFNYQNFQPLWGRKYKKIKQTNQ